MSKDYCAIIGDIIGSKYIKERDQTQTVLSKILDNINKKYEGELAAKFIITLGDEFQGLMKTTEHLIDIIDEIKFGLFPIRIRFGVGIGEMYTKIDPNQALGADGPAFYVARQAIKDLKLGENKNERTDADTLIYSASESKYNKDCERLPLVNAALATCRFIEKNWTEKQREVISYMRTNPQLTQYDIAQTIGIGQSGVYKRLKASGFYTYDLTKKAIQLELVRLWEG